MVLLAFSLQNQVEKYGAYVGIASFFGLAVLTLLYFAQAREVRRLREWAGRSPERAQELEERVAAQAEAVRRVPPQPARVPEPVPVAAATNGAHKLKPEQVAALAFARAAGVAEPPHPPRPAAVPAPVAVAVEAPPTEAAPVPPAPAPGPAPAAVPANGNGHGHGEVPPPITPAGRRAPAAAPLGATPPPRRPAPAPARRVPSGPPPRRETSARSVVLTLVVGIVAIALVAFAGIKLLGGGGQPATKAGNANPIVPSGGTATPSGGSKKATPTPTPSRDTTTVTVLNGTTEAGLAATQQDKLLTAGYAQKNTSAGNNPTTDQQRSASVVMYVSGARAKARDVARVLAIKDVRAIDGATQANGGGKEVVVVVGSDKSGS